MGGTKPFVPTDRVGIAANRSHVNWNHAHGLGSIDMEPDTAIARQAGDLVHGQNHAVRASDMAHLNYLGSRRNEIADTIEIFGCTRRVRFEQPHDHTTLLGLIEPGKRTAGMRM